MNFIASGEVHEELQIFAAPLVDVFKLILLLAKISNQQKHHPMSLLNERFFISLPPKSHTITCALRLLLNQISLNCFIMLINRFSTAFFLHLSGARN